jgi:hypothetical protein
VRYRHGADGISAAALQLGFGRKQIGQTFSLGEVDLAIGKCAAGEFAGLGAAQSGEAGKLGLDRSDYGAAAVEMEFDAAFASRGVAARKPQDERLIEHFAVRAAQSPQCGLIADRCPPAGTEQGHQRIVCSRAANPDYGNRGRRGAA